MPRNSTIKILRTTRANLNSQATANGLIVGEPYLITDESRFAIGTANNTYQDFAKLNEISGLFNGGSWIGPSISDFTHIHGGWMPQGANSTGSSTTGDFIGGMTTTGTATGRALNNTSIAANQIRYGTVSAATAASLCGIREIVTRFKLSNGTNNGGFFFSTIFMISDAAAVSGARQFVGLRNVTTAPTNIEPSTITNCIGIGHGAADSNLKLFISGATAQTPIDLGSNFPITFGSANAYQMVLYAPSSQSSFKLGWWVKRLGTSFIANGTITGALGTAVPDSATYLAYNSFRTNNATAAAVGLDFGNIYGAIPYE